MFLRIFKQASEDQRDALLFTIFYVVLTSLVVSYEYALVPADLLTLYFSLKAVAILGMIPIAFRLFCNPQEQVSVFLAGMLATFYTAVGEYFSPLYFVSYVQCMVAIIILLRPTKWSIYPVAALGGIPIVYIQHLKEIGVISHARPSVTADYIMIVIQFAIMFIIIFEGYSKRRRREIRFRERFSVIGESANLLLHNVKSLMAAQFLLAENIRENIDNEMERESLLDLQEKNLRDISEYLNGINKLARNEKEKVNAVSVVLEVAKMMKVPEEAIEFKGEEPSEFIVVKQELETIVMNIISNVKKCLENIGGNVEVQTQANHIRFSFPFSENYQTGSGIGLEMSKRLAQKNNLRMEMGREGRKFVVSLQT